MRFLRNVLLLFAFFALMWFGASCDCSSDDDDDNDDNDDNDDSEEDDDDDDSEDDDDDDTDDDDDDDNDDGGSCCGTVMLDCSTSCENASCMADEEQLGSVSRKKNDDDDNDDNDDDINGDDDDDDDDDDTTAFVEIPAGSFQMGSPEDEPGRQERETLHDVALTNDFEINAYEVTREWFEQVMGFDPGDFPDCGATCPAQQVSWYDAVAFTIELSTSKQLTPCYVLYEIQCEDGQPGNNEDYCKDQGGIANASISLNGVASVYECEGYRLPTEAEWEFAVRAGAQTALYNGPLVNLLCDPIDDNLHSVAWFVCNSAETPWPVGMKLSNSFGLYDGLGNVWEWVWDYYEDYRAGAQIDPEGPEEGTDRVVRGGSWNSDAEDCRAARRGIQPPAEARRIIGFRTVRTLPPL